MAAISAPGGETPPSRASPIPQGDKARSHQRARGSVARCGPSSVGAALAAISAPGGETPPSRASPPPQRQSPLTPARAWLRGAMWPFFCRTALAAISAPGGETPPSRASPLPQRQSPLTPARAWLRGAMGPFFCGSGLGRDQRFWRQDAAIAGKPAPTKTKPAHTSARVAPWRDGALLLWERPWPRSAPLKAKRRHRGQARSCKSQIASRLNQPGGANTRPGFMMPCGSSACLMARIICIATGDL